MIPTTRPFQLLKRCSIGLLLMTAAVHSLASSADGQTEMSPVTTINVTSPYSVRLGEPRTVKYQIGTKIKTGNAAFQRVKVILPVPAEWPEQTVGIVEEELYERAGEIEYRLLDGGVRQMMVNIPAVPANTEANVLITYEVNISPILPPESTTGLIIPQKRDKEISMALGESPMILPRDRELRKQVEEILSGTTPPPSKTESNTEGTPASGPMPAFPFKTPRQIPPSASPLDPLSQPIPKSPLEEADPQPESNELTDSLEPTAWDQAQRLHQWILDNIRETVTRPQSTTETLEKKQGCNEDRAALFVAMARSAKIPARMVMVEGSQHAEFCLEDPEGNRHWYPCTFRGSGEFGSVSRPAVVFQKGDNLKMPEQKKRARLITEYVNGRASSQPRVEIVRKVVR